MATLGSDLKAALLANPTAKDPVPKGFDAGVQYVAGRPDVITTPATPQLNGDEAYEKVVRDMGVTLPEGAHLVLSDAWYNPHAWTRESVDQEEAVTQASWRYKFKVVYDLALLPDEDLEALAKRVAKKRRSAGAAAGVAARATLDRSMVVALADLQISKVDSRGGTEELLERLSVALDGVKARVREVKPSELILVDPGDILEGFESSPSADRTNDIGQALQIRLARRILWSWVEELAPLCPSMVVAGVGSNHCRVRRGKQTMGDVLDDYGVENIIACSDLASMNPDAYGHVKFVVPKPYHESLALTLASGKVLGLVHGHQKSNPDRFGDWFAGQALGRTPAGQADIVVFGHFHQLRVQTVGDDRWIFVCPTMDSGSSWFTNNTGHDSRPGVLTFLVEDTGWSGLHVVWAT